MTIFTKGHKEKRICSDMGLHTLVVLYIDPGIQSSVTKQPPDHPSVVPFVEAHLLNCHIGQQHEVFPRLLAYIRGIGDELAQEDILVGVQAVDDDIHQPVDLGLEFELLSTATLAFQNSFAARVK
jgi:hypothetical protein